MNMPMLKAEAANAAPAVTIPVISSGADVVRLAGAQAELLQGAHPAAPVVICCQRCCRRS